MTDRRTRSPAPEAPAPQGPASERSPGPGLVLHGRYRLLRQVGRGAMGEAHRAGIVHRDVKPANVIVSGTGMVKVTDLGIAGSVEADPGDDGAMYGTLPYVAPERLRGPSAGPPADVYALGVVLYEMLAGRRPFEAGSAEALRPLHEAGPPPLTHIPRLRTSRAHPRSPALCLG